MLRRISLPVQYDAVSVNTTIEVCYVLEEE